VKPLDQINLASPELQHCHSQGICAHAGRTAEADCLASCFICTPSTVHPDFLLLSILYAPPGNASTSTFGQSAAAGVSYGITNNISQSSGSSISVADVFSSIGFSVNIQNGFSRADQFSAVTTSTSTENLRSGKDPLDHQQDIFLLWLNPVVTLTQSDKKTLAAQITSGDAQMSVQAVSASQLMNGIPAEKLAPTQICPTPATCYMLPGLGSLTKADIKSILAEDPFLTMAPNQVPDSSRFKYIQSIPLQNTVVASGATQTFLISDAHTASQTTTQSSSSSDGVTTGLLAKISGAGINFTNSDSWTWNHTLSQGTSSGQTQQASATLSSTTQSCCGISKDVSCEVSIWEDMVYRTFVFVPQPETCQATLTGASPALHVAATMLATTLASFNAPSLRGSVTQGSTVAGGETVTISTLDGKILWRVITDSLGRYFSGAILPGPVNVQVGKKTHQVTVKPGQGVVLNVKM